MNITTKIYAENPARFDLAGQKLSTTLQEKDEMMSEHLAKRIVAYAKVEIYRLGFNVHRDHFNAEVSTTDGNSKRSERAYSVTFINKYGGKIGIQGILTKNGYPILHHGLFVQEKDF